MLALLKKKQKKNVCVGDVGHAEHTQKLKHFVVLVLLKTYKGLWCGNVGLSETYNNICFGDAGLAENIQKCMIW